MPIDVYVCLYVSGDVCISTYTYMQTFVCIWTPEADIESLA